MSEIQDLIAMGAFDGAGDDDMGLGAVTNPLANLMAQFRKRVAPRPVGKPRPSTAMMPYAPPPVMPAQYERPQYAPPQFATPAAGQLYDQFARDSAVPGVRASRGARYEQLGPNPAFVTFTPASAQTVTVAFTPYKPAKPVRLIVDVQVSGTPGVLVLLQNAAIGDRNQLAGRNGVSVAAYGPAATFARIAWDVILPSLPLELTFATTGVPAAGTSITIAPALFVATLS